MIGQAQTGTGKTAAFGLPVLERVDGNERHVQVVILSPTRELAIQVAEELNKMAQYTNITALPIYGGQDINRQFPCLEKKSTNHRCHSRPIDGPYGSWFYPL